MEGQLTDDVSYALTHGADESDRLFMLPVEELTGSTGRTPTPSREAIDLTQEIGAATNAVTAATNALRGNTPTIPLTVVPKGGVPVDTDIGNTGLVSSSPTLSATEFDNDPEVSTCLLTDKEKSIKERIWVAENAEWLRKDHYKRIQKELHEAAMVAEGRDPAEEAKKKKQRRLGNAPYMEQVRARRKERASQTPAGEQAENEDEIARREAAEATYEMVKNRAKTAFSRRFNQESMDGIWGALAEGSRSSSPRSSPQLKTAQARARSRISSISTQRSADAEPVFQPPDEDGPMGPGMARSKHSLAASKREAKKWEAFRKEREKETRRQPARPRQPPRAGKGKEKEGSRPASSGSSEPALPPEEEVGGLETGVDEMASAAPGSSAAGADPATQGAAEAGEADEAGNSDENMSTSEEDEDDDELDEMDDEPDPEDAFAGRVRRRYDSDEESDEE